MKAIVKSFIYGMGIGSFISFFFYLVYGLTSISVTTLGVVSFCSGLIGIISVILFELLVIEARIAFLIHYALTLAVMITMSIINHWKRYLITPRLLVVFTVIYAIVWVIELWMNHKRVANINQKLKSRKIN